MGDVVVVVIFAFMFLFLVDKIFVFVRNGVDSWSVNGCYFFFFVYFIFNSFFFCGPRNLLVGML